MPYELKWEFATADDAVHQLKSELFTFDQYDPIYPWRSYNGLVAARVIWSDKRNAYTIEAIA